MSDINNRYPFRGKRIDNGEWVEGDHVNGYIVNYIDLATSWEPNTADHKLTVRAFAVNPSTIGLIGSVLGQKIAVGDILHCFNAQSNWPDKPFGATEIVEFKEGCLWLRYRNMPIIQFLQLSNGNKYAVSVAGNRWDNPELLE